MEKLKGVSLYHYIQEKKDLGLTLGEISTLPKVRMKLQTLKNFRGRYKKKLGIVKSTKPGKGSTQQVQTFLLPGKTKNGTTPTVAPTLEDTRGWTWERWSFEFLDLVLLPHHVFALKIMDKTPTILNDPRQFGKTTSIVMPFNLRKLCETVFDEEDRPLLYVSVNFIIVRNMTLTLRNHLLTNPKILANYGDLVDQRFIKGLKASSQRQTEINLTTRRSLQNISFRATSIDSGIRGTTARYTVVDDPIDHKVVEEKDPVKVTQDFMAWFILKILPLTQDSFFVIGTRYFKEDIYYRLSKLRVFEWIIRKAIIGPIPRYRLPPEFDEKGKPIVVSASDVVIEDDFGSKLLSDVIWGTIPGSPLRGGTPMQNICLRHHTMEIDVPGSFAQELMNEAMERNVEFQWDWIQSYIYPPVDAGNMTWVVGHDDAMGETKASDYTAFVLMGLFAGGIYIHDLIYGRWTDKVKKEKLEEFVSEHARELKIPARTIKVVLETVLNQRSFYHLIRDDSWIIPKRWEQSRKGKKKIRIMRGIAGQAENKRLFVREVCRNKAQLKREVMGFPRAKHEHILDAANTGLNFLKPGNKKKTKGIRNSNPRGIGARSL